MTGAYSDTHAMFTVADRKLNDVQGMCKGEVWGFSYGQEFSKPIVLLVKPKKTIVFISLWIVLSQIFLYDLIDLKLAMLFYKKKTTDQSNLLIC